MDHILELLLDLFLVNKGPTWLQWTSKFFLLCSIVAVVWWLAS